MASASNPFNILTNSRDSDSRSAIVGSGSNELIFAVVGHAGSGTSVIAKALAEILRDTELKNRKFEVHLLKAREVIKQWAENKAKTAPIDRDHPLLSDVETYQNLGDEMRGQVTSDGRTDHAAVARGLVKKIRERRAQSLHVEVEPGKAVLPDGQPRAYILDALRHPEEVRLLRSIYQDAFVLIGVVCEEEKRISRITAKFRDAGRDAALDFMERDASAKEKHGQHVGDAFHLGDFFIDNTVDQLTEGNRPNPDWDINEHLSRLVKIVTHSALVRPTISETAMHHAFTAALQSACLSRQVGAALVDKTGSVVATGSNEVPKAGGGVYGEAFQEEAEDSRCAMMLHVSDRYCRNTREQNTIIDALIQNIAELKNVSPARAAELPLLLRKTRIGSLLEFSRAVHAEMDAILSAAREGTPVVATRLFVTAFPCHYCARHIVSAGIDEVQYIEPYPKSQALQLHKDAIQVEYTQWTPPSQGGTKVLFRPFAGVAPRLYKRAFRKDRELKDGASGDMQFSEPTWGYPWHLSRLSYVEIEAELTNPEGAIQWNTKLPPASSK